MMELLILLVLASMITSTVTYSLFSWLDSGMVLEFLGKWINKNFGKIETDEEGEKFYEPKKFLYTPLFCSWCANVWVHLGAILILDLWSFGAVWCIGYVFFGYWFISKYG